MTGLLVIEQKNGLRIMTTEVEAHNNQTQGKRASWLWYSALQVPAVLKPGLPLTPAAILLSQTLPSFKKYIQLFGPALC